MSANGGLGFFGRGGARFRLAFGFHLIKRQFVFFPIKLFRHPSVDEGEVYRINVRIKNDLIKVPDDYRQRREHRFVEMNGQRDINPPAREETEKADLEPYHQAGETHDQRSPDDGPVFRLLGITKASNLRLDAPESNVIAEIANHIADVF